MGRVNFNNFIKINTNKLIITHLLKEFILCYDWILNRNIC